MDSSVEGISAEYERRYGDAVRSSAKLRDLYDRYIRRRETTLLDAVAATAAVDALFFADEIDMDAVPSQMGEAFARAYPGQDLGQRLEELRDLEPGSPEVIGFLSNWKGVYHEVLIRDRLNDGSQIGHVVLGEGQSAVLAEELNQPGLDLRILNADRTEDLLLQAKATSDVGLLNEALQKYPDIEILATDEAAGEFTDERIFPSGFSNEDLQDRVMAPMEELWDGPAEELVETILPGLPFVIILTIEGTRVLLGRQSFQGAMRNSLERGAKTGTAMAVGALAALAGAGVFSLPAAFVTRLGIDRAQIYGRLASKIEADVTQLLSVVRRVAINVDESNGNSGKGHQASVGMAIGAGMGVSLGAGVGAALENVGLGAAIGVALGVGVGLTIGTVLSTHERE